MADIAIFRINYKSDFILTLQSDAGWTTPFCIKFWTGAPSQAYFVGYDGTTYTHCAPVVGDPTKLAVQFDDHGLPIGNLKFQIGYHFTVADFPTAVEDEVINQATVIIDQDGTPMQVMLDFQGETAPEIQFSLPAYANEAQRIANEQQRIADEQERIENEQQRIAEEETRQAQEAQRIAQETARVNEFATLKAQSQAATSAADTAAALANEKAQLAADKAALAQQKADYAQTQGDYAKAQGDTAQADHERAEADHATAAADHTTAQADHTQAATDHTTAAADHTTAQADHAQAVSDHAAVEPFADSLGAYDISSAHASGGVMATYADLTDALGTNGANIPEGIRKGGMSVKFVQSSDSKYVQYRLMSQTFSTTESDWQGVDDVPTDSSDNLVTSGGVKAEIDQLGFLDDTENVLYEIQDGDGNVVFRINNNGLNAKLYNLCSSDGTVVATLTAEMLNSFVTANDLAQALQDVAQVDNEDGDVSSLFVVDKNGECALQVKGGHIRTKHFDSAKAKQTAFSNLGMADLSIVGTAEKTGSYVSLNGGINNRAVIDSPIQCWHYVMMAKFNSTGAVSFMMGKYTSSYGGMVKIANNKCYIYTTGLDVTPLEYELGFNLASGEDYTLKIQVDRGNTNSFKVELFGQYNEYFTQTNSVATAYPFYGLPFVASDNACTLKDFSFSISNYYDIRNIKVAVFGHSLVEADTLRSRREECWVSLLGDAIGSNRVVNFGRGGETCQGLFNALRGDTVLAQNAEYGIIEIGTNDTSQTTDYIVGYLDQMCKLLENNNIKPILCNIQPFETGLGDNMIAVNTWIASSGYMYIDMNQVFYDANGDLRTSYFATEDVFVHDGIHVNFEAHKEMFRRVVLDCPYLF